MRYRTCKPIDVPAGVRWDVKPSESSETTEVAYADWPTTTLRARCGAPYKRVTVVASKEVRYYRGSTV